MRRSLAVLCLGVLALPGISHGAELLQTSADGAVVFRGSYGIAAIEANELVYSGRGKVSQLIWDSSLVSTFTGGVTVDLDRFFLRATATIGMGGDGHMRDYDWLEPGIPWTDRSIHPDTRLNHYFSGSIDAGAEIFARDGLSASLGAGVRYTDIKWTAWGGSYVYTSADFRDTRGKFPDDAKAISYRQQWPVPFIGLDLSHRAGPWTLAGTLQGGMAIDGRGTDDHWMRDVRFVDHVETTPALMTSASAAYEFRPDTAIFVSGAFDRIFRGRADTDMIDRRSGDRSRFPDGAGADFMSMSLSLGLRGKF